MNRIPYLPIVVAVSAFVLFGFAAVSAYVLIYTGDDVTKGNVIGTWQNFALLAVGFWLGSSSGGKSKTETGDEPLDVNVTNPPDKPVQTEEAGR